MRRLGDSISRRLNRPLGWYVRRNRYPAKVLRYNPIAYWPEAETAGETANCLVNPAQNGTHSGVDLGQIVTDSNLVSFICPYYDGANDYSNVLTNTLSSVFNGSELTIAAWVRVNDSSAWSDGTLRVIFNIFINANNNIRAYKQSGTNGIACEYDAGGTAEFFASGAVSSTDWIHVLVTVSKTTNSAVLYINGVSTGSAGTLGNWVGGALTVSTIGANSIVPASVWHGWVSNVAIWDLALSTATISDLATA